jgi:hypothetical protein
MPDSVGPASEFGGKVQRNGVQPPPHIPTAKERLSLIYRTGSESGTADPDPNGDIWAGLRDEATQRAVREAEGVLNKGEVWEEMVVAGEAAIAEIESAEPQDEV